MTGFVDNISQEEKLNSFGGTELTLPSRGFLYSPVVEKVTIEPMRTYHERMLAGTGQRESMDVWLKVMKDCVKLDMDLNKLLLGDAVFIMIMIRTVSFGGETRCSFVCQECGDRFLADIRIPEDLNIIELSEKDKPPFYVYLPVTNKTIGWRYLTVTDEKFIVQQAKRIIEKNLIQVQDTKNIILSVRRAQMIVSIDDKNVAENHCIMEKINFVDNLIVKDSYIFQRAVDSKAFGLDTRKELTCSNCGYATEYDVSITPEFFRPQLDISRYIRTDVPAGNVGKIKVE